MSTRDGTIYFITCERPGFPIKIGFASDIDKRLTGIQSCLPYKIKVLALQDGDLAREKEILDAFVHLRLRGEWFKRDKQLLEFIDFVLDAVAKDIEAEQAMAGGEGIIELPSRPPGMSDLDALRLGIA